MQYNLEFFTVQQVCCPSPEELQALLVSVVTQNLIQHLNQLITQLPHLTWFLAPELCADFKVK